MAKGKKRRRKARPNYVYGRSFAGHQKEKKSLIWTDSKERNKDSIL